MKTIYRLIFLFSVLTLIAQNKNSKTENYNSNWHKDYVFSIDINTFIPKGNLKESLDKSLGIGFYFGVPVSKNVRIDLGVSLFFPETKKSIKYINGEEILEGGAMTSGALGIWTSHITPVRKNWSWEKRMGLGLGFFQTDIETGKPKEENDSVYGAETIFLSLGTGFRTRFFNRNIGLKLDYFHTPYNLFEKKFPSNFGDSYLTLGLSFGI